MLHQGITKRIRETKKNSCPPNPMSHKYCRRKRPTRHTENTRYMGISSTWMTTMKKKYVTPFTDSGITKREQNPKTHAPRTPRVVGTVYTKHRLTLQTKKKVDVQLSQTAGMEKNKIECHLVHRQHALKDSPYSTRAFR